MGAQILLTANGRTANLSTWARSLGLSAPAFRKRIVRGWSLERVLSTPKRKQRPPPPTKPPRRPLPLAMTLTEATNIAGTLGRTSKMPGYSYGLDAWQCITGGELVDVPGSVCFKCYARKNFYRTWRPARIARERRHAGLEHPRWADAMVTLISHRCAEAGELFFRWHDSGDVMSLEHLERIVDVARRTPAVKHWLPTREYGFLEAYLRAGGTFPDNLVVRVSAHMVDERPKLPRRLRVLPTSTVNREHGVPVQVDDVRRHSIECKAYTRDNQCGACRACWDARVRNVSYLEH